eukprot:4391658-Pyramimonas_sp.AAC.1
MDQSCSSVAGSDEKETILEKVREVNRDVARTVNGVPKELFQTLTKQKLFSETRKFSELAEALQTPPLQIFQAGRNAWTCFALQVRRARMHVN